MLGFVKVSNQLFDLQLRPNAFMVYIYLSSKCNYLLNVTITSEQISKGCGICSKSVQSAIKELENKELLYRQNRFDSRGYKTANRYSLQKHTVKGRGWFAVPREVFRTAINPVDFMVYCFLLRHMDIYKKEAFPSLATIASGTGLSRSRIIQAIHWLHRFSYINRMKRHYRNTRAWKHNRYLLLNQIHNSNNTQAKEKAHAQRHRLNPTVNIVYRIFEAASRGFKYFFRNFRNVFLRGSPYFTQQY